jgi:hypothetical protein
MPLCPPDSTALSITTSQLYHRASLAAPIRASCKYSRTKKETGQREVMTPLEQMLYTQFSRKCFEKKGMIK